MTRIAVIDNTKLKDMGLKKHIQSLCPVNRAGKECIYFEGEKLYIAENVCIGCGICVNAAPDAIKVINLPEELKQDPIHRYGKNDFALYSLPVPVMGKVVGLLGINGIGKSTAIKIIAGVLKPNLSKEDHQATYKELTQFFKGTEAQQFFELLDKGKITSAYKPQHVDLIPKTTQGKVGDLLRKIDSGERFETIVHELELATILEHDLASISGGELQRVAIAATLLKKANLYIFDEPTSYLDIKQRLKVAKIIRDLANDETAVLVIEHDLIALDYMTDLIHIMYGKEGAYGIVSLPKASKQGINIYLDGYLKEENVRFRDYRIHFEVKAAIETKQRQALSVWPKLKKKQGSFLLETTEGKISRNEIVGVLGENGIGKTTLMKMLAGLIKPDSGEIEEHIKIAYKPQYLDNTSEEIVMMLLQDALERHSADIIVPLNIKTLFMKRICDLSGGELQRVAIALALSRKADLILLDEPSAYLDVEQRLTLSKVIRNVTEVKGVSALVIDHDLLFLDYLSNRLLVFEGTPAVHGTAKGPFQMEEGMNMLLSHLGITLRRDELSKRPRINKEESYKDRQQKEAGKYYYQ